MSGIRLSSQLRAEGFLAGEIEGLVRDGTLRRIRRGAYAKDAGSADGLTELDTRAEYRRLIEATLIQCDPEAALSHVSAAVLHGLPVPRDHLGRVHLTRNRPGGGRTRRWVQVHGSSLTDADVERVDGLKTTTVARTLVDLGCTLPLRAAVPVGDAALRRGLDPDALTRSLGRAGRRSGINAARRLAASLDGRSESPGESVSRVLFADHGVPAPQPQFVVNDATGHFVGRCDFGWPGLRTLGEFDGRIKYGRALAPGGDLEAVLFEEKLREDRLRDLGWQIVRWVWADLMDPVDLLARLERAFARSRRLGSR